MITPVAAACVVVITCLHEGRAASKGDGPDTPPRTVSRARYRRAPTTAIAAARERVVRYDVGVVERVRFSRKKTIRSTRGGVGVLFFFCLEGVTRAAQPSRRLLLNSSTYDARKIYRDKSPVL